MRGSAIKKCRWKETSRKRRCGLIARVYGTAQPGQPEALIERCLLGGAANNRQSDRVDTTKAQGDTSKT
jgi:hypothetical protein